MEEPTYKRRSWAQQPSKWISGYLFAGPAIILIVIFSLVAIAFSLYVSFFDYDIISPNRPFIGLSNYKEALFRDKLFLKSFKNTALYVIGVVPGITITAFLLALAGHKVRWGRDAFRTIYFLPSITPAVAMALVWVWLYSPKGMINQALSMIGVQGPNWLMNTRWAMPSVIVMSVWMSVGYYTVIYLAGMADIPNEFYDAARVDGANAWQEIRHVTMPLLRNVTSFVTVTLGIFAFQVFTQVYIMTKGGPGDATVTLQLLIFRNGFQYFRMGYAAAISWLLFIVIFVLALIQLRGYRSQQLF